MQHSQSIKHIELVTFFTMFKYRPRRYIKISGFYKFPCDMHRSAFLPHSFLKVLHIIMPNPQHACNVYSIVHGLVKMRFLFPGNTVNLLRTPISHLRFSDIFNFAAVAGGKRKSISSKKFC